MDENMYAVVDKKKKKKTHDLSEPVAPDSTYSMVTASPDTDTTASLYDVIKRDTGKRQKIEMPEPGRIHLFQNMKIVSK